MSDTTCSRWSYGGRMSWPCPRPVKAEGLCAQHLAGEKRRRANDAKRAEETCKDEAVQNATEAACASLAALGIKATPQFSSSSFKHTGRVIVDPAVLLDLLSNHDCVQGVIDQERNRA